MIHGSDAVHGVGLDGEEREDRQESAQHLRPFDHTGQTTPANAPLHLSPPLSRAAQPE